MIGRRAFVAGAAVAATLPMEVLATMQDNGMHGLIGRLRAAPGQRDALIAILIEGTANMPGCLSYIVARDATEADAIWVTEVWDSRESHRWAAPTASDAGSSSSCSSRARRRAAYASSSSLVR